MNYSQYPFEQPALENSFNNLSFQTPDKLYGETDDTSAISNNESFRSNSIAHRYQYYNNKESPIGKENRTQIWQNQANSLQIKDSAYSTNGNQEGNSYISYENEEGDENLELLLQIKDAQIELLETEIGNIKKLFSEGMKQNQKVPHSTTLNQNLEIPTSLLHIFKRLSSALQETETELEETKSALECLLTGVALEPSNTSTKYGRYDVESLAHKMIVRIESLTSENQEMAKMIAYGRSKEKHIELELVKNENRKLKEQILQLQEQHENQNRSKSETQPTKLNKVKKTQ